MFNHRATHLILWHQSLLPDCVGHLHVLLWNNVHVHCFCHLILEEPFHRRVSLHTTSGNQKHGPCKFEERTWGWGSLRTFTQLWFKVKGVCVGWGEGALVIKIALKCDRRDTKFMDLKCDKINNTHFIYSTARHGPWLKVSIRETIC